MRIDYVICDFSLRHRHCASAQAIRFIGQSQLLAIVGRAQTLSHDVGVVEICARMKRLLTDTLLHHSALGLVAIGVHHYLIHTWTSLFFMLCLGSTSSPWGCFNGGLATFRTCLGWFLVLSYCAVRLASTRARAASPRSRQLCLCHSCAQPKPAAITSNQA
eukprot:3670791-Amphidinium_carterae.1